MKMSAIFSAVSISVTNVSGFHHHDDVLDVVDPDHALLTAGAAAEVDDVALVRRREHGALGLDDLRHAHARRLAGAGTHEPDLHPFPRRVELPAGQGDGRRQRHARAGLAGTEALGVFVGRFLEQVDQIALLRHRAGFVVDPRPRAPLAQRHDDQEGADAGGDDQEPERRTDLCAGGDEGAVEEGAHDRDRVACGQLLGPGVGLSSDPDRHDDQHHEDEETAECDPPRLAGAGLALPARFAAHRSAHSCSTSS
jgi:hypothetical protein